MTPLRWAPPPLVNPTILNLPTGFFDNSATPYGVNEDVLVNYPVTARNRVATIIGGRNVRVIGGKHTQGTAQGRALSIGSVSGSIFVEGLSIDMAGFNGDALNLQGSSAGPYTFQPDIYIQNCFVKGLTGDVNSTFHPDGFQPQGSVRNIFIDRFTVQTQYQALFLDNQAVVSHAYLSRINARYSDADNGFLYWWGNPQSSAGTYPTYLSEVYADLSATTRTLLTGIAWPKQGEVDGSSNPIGAVTSDGSATIHWPAITQIQGSVTSGAPPGGDFAPEASVGLNYVSPGYLTGGQMFGSRLYEPDAYTIG